MKWSSVLVVSLVGGLFLPGAEVRADPPRTEPARVAVEAGKTGEPISKYIYGQFIEHLGRCIYGGIWAEMLEDRKFYYDVGAKDSPWKTVGGPVAMEKTDPFVGSHTPRVTAPGGIAQGDLALRKGHKYVGRVWLAGEAGAAPVTVSLVWGDGPEDRQTVTVEKLTAEYARTPLTFVAGADTDKGRLEIVGGGKGKVLVGPASLMPADNVSGLRADTLALLKELNAPLYRWPGGNFVSGYDRKDGIGDPDRRPPRKNPAWKGVEPNDMGLDEFITFCRQVGAEPYITVNTGLGDVAGAADEVQYANGAADTPMGRLREERPPGAVRGDLVGRRQRDVRQVAAGVHAAGEVRRQAQPVRPGHAPHRSEGQADRRGGRGGVERRDAQRMY